MKNSPGWTDPNSPHLARNGSCKSQTAHLAGNDPFILKSDFNLLSTFWLYRSLLRFSKFQEFFYCEPSLFYYLAKQIATYCVTAMNRNRGYAFCYRMKIVLMTSMRFRILKSSTNQLAYYYTRCEYRDNAYAKTGTLLARAVNRTLPSCTASAITRASTIPSMHSAIIFFAWARFLPHETAPCTFGAVTTYPPISASGSNTALKEPYLVFITAVFMDIFDMCAL